MAIHKIKDTGTFLISSYDTWRQGCYESERAARYAFSFPDEILKALQDKVNERPLENERTITFEMLQKARKEI